jgi:hypothetical protein
MGSKTAPTGGHGGQYRATAKPFQISFCGLRSSSQQTFSTTLTDCTNKAGIDLRSVERRKRFKRRARAVFTKLPRDPDLNALLPDRWLTAKSEHRWTIADQRKAELDAQSE